MNKLIGKITGMAPLTNQVVGTDMLMAAKAEIRNYALAITETASPEVRETLTKQLDDVIEIHEQIANYMIKNDYYNPHDTSKQLEVDMKTVNTALNIAND